jgi:hypothetical protein
LEHSDAPIHWECLFAWAEVDRFLRLLHAGRRRFFEGNPYWTVLADTDRYRVATNRLVVDVDVAQVGMGWQVPIEEWPAGLRAKLTDGELDVLPDSLRHIAEESIREILSRFQQVG